MEDAPQLELPSKPDQVAATKVALERLRKAASKAPPTLQELAALRSEVHAKRVEDDVRIVELDGKYTVWAWLCRSCRESLKEGWYVKSMKDAPHPLPCDRCFKERAK